MTIKKQWKRGDRFTYKDGETGKVIAITENSIWVTCIERKYTHEIKDDKDIKKQENVKL